jgi:hypothetical protein
MKKLIYRRVRVKKIELERVPQLIINKVNAVNIQISADRKSLWVCTDEHMTILRIKNINTLTITELGEE